MSDSFWNFSLKTYGAPGLAPLLLAFQAKHGTDLNLLLYAGWLGASGRGEAGCAHFADCLERTRHWQGKTAAALRGVKHALKAWTDESFPAQSRESLRKQVAGLEIEAERIEQEVLEQTAPAVTRQASAGGERARAAARNLLDLLAVLGVRLGAEEEAVARGLLQAAVPGLRAEAVEALLREDLSA